MGVGFGGGGSADASFRRASGAPQWMKSDKTERKRGNESFTSAYKISLGGGGGGGVPTSTHPFLLFPPL